MGWGGGDIPSRVCLEKQKCATSPEFHRPVSAVGRSKRRLSGPMWQPLRLYGIHYPTACECLHWDTGSPVQPPATGTERQPTDFTSRITSTSVKTGYNTPH